MLFYEQVRTVREIWMGISVMKDYNGNKGEEVLENLQWQAVSSSTDGSRMLGGEISTICIWLIKAREDGKDEDCTDQRD